MLLILHGIKQKSNICYFFFQSLQKKLQHLSIKYVYPIITPIKSYTPLTKNKFSYNYADKKVINLSMQKPKMTFFYKTGFYCAKVLKC